MINHTKGFRNTSLTTQEIGITINFITHSEIDMKTINLHWNTGLFIALISEQGEHIGSPLRGSPLNLYPLHNPNTLQAFHF